MGKLFVLRIKICIKIDGEIKSMKVDISKEILQQVISHISGFI